MPEIQQLLRSIAIINSPSTHRKDLENYQQLCSNNETGGKPRRASDAPSDQMSTRGISQTIHIAANLQRLACMCVYDRNYVTAVATLEILLET